MHSGGAAEGPIPEPVDAKAGLSLGSSGLVLDHIWARLAVQLWKRCPGAALGAPGQRWGCRSSPQQPHKHNIAQPCRL